MSTSSFEKYLKGIRPLSVYISVVVVFLATESVLRWMQFGPKALIAWDQFNPQDGLFSDFKVKNSNPVLRWSQKESWKGYFKGQWVELNRFGYRSDEWAIQDKDRSRTVAVFGRSDAFGTGVPRESIWAEVMAKDLGVKLMNFSVYGYSLYQVEELIRLEAPRFGLKNIVLPIYLHEWTTPIPKQPSPSRLPVLEVENPIEKFLGYFYFFPILKTGLQVFAQHHLAIDWIYLPSSTVPPKGLKKYSSAAQVIYRLIGWCQLRGINLTVLVLPRPFFKMSLSDFQARSQIKDNLESHPTVNVMFADLVDDLPAGWNDMIYWGEFHPKSEGHEVVGHHVARHPNSKRILNGIDFSP